MWLEKTGYLKWGFFPHNGDIGFPNSDTFKQKRLP
jgi:hypothetical protein